MTGRVALITGAGSGIGRAVALSLGEHGYQVVLTGRRREPLEEVAHAIAAAGGRALAIPTDVTDPVSVAAAFDMTVSHWGRLDLLFNNAGISAPATAIDELDVETWRSVIDINLTGAFLCIKNAFRVMKGQTPRGGRIINNGSISAHSPRPRSFPYTASKHAMTGLTKCASLDGREFDIACGQIDIGNAETDMTAAMPAGVPQADNSIAAEPVMDPSHVGNAVLYMDRLPPQANVQFMTLMATKMPFIGRG